MSDTLPPLHAAIEALDAEALAAALAEGADPNAPVPWEPTGHTPLVRLLREIQRRALLSHDAGYATARDLGLRLIGRGARPWGAPASPAGACPLPHHAWAFAAATDTLDLAEAWWPPGALPAPDLPAHHAPTGQNGSALDLALHQGHWGAVERLRSRGAPWTQGADGHWGSLEWALDGKTHEKHRVQAAVLAMVAAGCRPVDPARALGAAFRQGVGSEALPALLAAGWPLDSRTDQGVPLIAAAAAGSPGWFEALLAAGGWTDETFHALGTFCTLRPAQGQPPDPAERPGQGLVALLVLAGRLDGLTLALRARPDAVDRMDLDGRTAMHHAASHAHPAERLGLLTQLLAAGANPAHRDARGVSVGQAWMARVSKDLEMSWTLDWTGWNSALLWALLSPVPAEQREAWAATLPVGSPVARWLHQEALEAALPPAQALPRPARL